MLGAFGFQALGALAAPASATSCSSLDPTLDAWRWMYATAMFPACSSPLGRFFITESANWLHARGAHRPGGAARCSACCTASRNTPQNSAARATPAAGHETDDGKPRFAALFNGRNRRATIFASVPWFLQDLGTYGIGIFTPTILAAAIGNEPDHIRSVSDLISDDILAAKGAAMINVLLIVGIVFAVLLADRVGRIWLQVVGFVGCAVGLLIASFADRLHRRDADRR